MIDHAQRGKGLGSKLMDSINDTLKEQNIELASNSSRVLARRFFERHGFICTHNKFVRSL